MTQPTQQTSPATQPTRGVGDNTRVGSSGEAPIPAVPRPLPVPTEVTRPYWDAAAQGRLAIQTCQACGHRQFYPRVICTACLSDDLQWQDSAGTGTIYSYTVNHRGPSPFFKGRTPYVVAVVDLDEGVRMMANVLDGPAPALAIGARVKVQFEEAGDGVCLPQFVLA